MKAFLKRFWPWKEINELRQRISFLTSELDRERNQHDKTKSENIAIKGELKIHQVKAVEREGHVRKMAQIIAIKGGILAVLFICFSISAQPFIRNPVTTNTLGNAPTTAYFLGWDGILTKPAWLVPPVGISVAVNTNAVAVTNGQLVTISGVTDTNAVNGLLGSVTNGAINNLSNYVFTLSQNATNQSLKIGGNDTNNDILMSTGITNGAINNLSNYVNTISVNATNQGTVVSNGVVAHTVTVAGTANQIASSVGTAQTLASNPSTTLSLPNPLIAPGVVSVNGFTNQAEAGSIGVVTNDVNGKNGSSATLPAALFPALSGIVSTVAGSTTTFSSGTWTNAIDSTNVTITGPTQIYGDKFRTNGSYISNSGEVFSNNLGTVTVQGGKVIASLAVSGNGITNSSFAAIGVVTNDANGKEYTTPLLDPALLNLVNATNNASTKEIDSLNTANSVVVEEFPGSSGNSLTIGTHGWRSQNSAGGSVVMTTGVHNHPGIVQIITGTTSGEGALITLAATNSISFNCYDDLSVVTGWTNTWIFRLSATNDAVMYLGMVNNLVFLSTEPANWFGLKIDSTSLNAYQYVSRSGSSSTTANGPALDTLTWHRFSMWSTVAGTLNFSIDGANAQSIATIPAQTVGPMAMVRKSAANNSVNLQVDYYSMVISTLSR